MTNGDGRMELDDAEGHDGPARRAPMHIRDVLPSTRRSHTHKFAISGFEGYLTVGLFDDDRPGEIFIKISKEGSTLSGLVQGFCRCFSICLQYGLPVEEAVSRFKGMRFEPNGPTSNAEIPQCTSILDYIASYLEMHFGKAKAAA
jgi:ribonucleoside-diphosphate reductase alpha chain